MLTLCVNFTFTIGKMRCHSDVAAWPVSFIILLLHSLMCNGPWLYFARLEIIIDQLSCESPLEGVFQYIKTLFHPPAKSQ